MDFENPIIVVEDQLSEEVCRRLLSLFNITPVNVIGLRGRGYIEKRSKELNRTAAGYPVFVLADLDRDECAPQFLSKCIGSPFANGLLFRVAVTEVESWILADRVGFSNYLRLPKNKIPVRTDEIEDPKQFLVNLARKCKLSGYRDDIVPKVNSGCQTGPAYNIRLIDFVRNHWNIDSAKEASESLNRALNSIETRTTEPRQAP